MEGIKINYKEMVSLNKHENELYLGMESVELKKKRVNKISIQ
jgi:hypothetical protein